MQPVNDDMDNLFRRAADEYLLNTSGANFDKVRLQADAEPAMPGKKEPKRRYLWLLLLLLVPASFLIKHYQADPVPQYSQNNTAVQQERKNNLPVTTMADRSSNSSGKEKLQMNEKEMNEPANNIADQSVTPFPETAKVKKGLDDNVGISQSNNNTGKQQPAWKQNGVSTNQTGRQSTTVISKKDRKLEAGNEIVFLSSGVRKINNTPVSLVQKEENEKGNERLVNAKNASIIKETTKGTGRHFADSATKLVALKETTDSSAISSANKIKTNNVAAKDTTAKIKNKTQPFLYAGIIAGPDFSAVKSTKIGSAGYNIGFIAGYQTGRHLAFETGVVWNSKRYYSKGKHVSLAKLGLPPHTEVLYLNGTCEMIEIPLSVRYHFNARAKNNWYAGAGVSSYIMKQEKYNYKYKRYNTEYYQGKKYGNTSQHWLSVVQLNIGYEIKLKQAGSLRIEPYAKLPLQGLGIGKLPISGAGINVGFTLPIY